MIQKQQKSNSIRIWLNIHKNFLQQFDTQTKNNYSSRNEAIRHGMKLVLIEITNYKTNKTQTQNPDHTLSHIQTTTINNNPKEDLSDE
ncbi:MAG: hypothetical protein FWF66_07025 [Candidatus Bathyarchaeota archaeon]|nr:hypothetical protein [Candidatus Termiticorpusculum sp.]